MEKRFDNAPEEKSSAGNYFKVKDWETKKVRLLWNRIYGYEYFNNDNKPVRSRNEFTSTPDIKKDGKVKVFRAFTIRDYEAEKVKIREITQASIKDQLRALTEDEDWGVPTSYDIKIKREWEGLDTKYSVTPSNKSDFQNFEAISEGEKVRLEALYDWDDPFTPF